MKKILLSVLALVMLVPSLAFAALDTNLKYGSSGSEVTELQSFLIQKGFLVGQATGNFFSLTEKAVVAYQASVGLPDTGFVGAMTRADINSDSGSATASDSSVSNSATATSTSTQATNNATLCNGTYYTQCSAGNDFICPSGGGAAFCQPSQAQKLANLQAQLLTYQNEWAQIQTKEQQDQNTYNAQCSNLSLGFQQGLGQIEAQEKAENCDALAQGDAYDIQVGTPIVNEISYIQQEISSLRY